MDVVLVPAFWLFASLWEEVTSVLSPPLAPVAATCKSMDGAAVAAAVIHPRGASGQTDLNSVRFQERPEKHP